MNRINVILIVAMSAVITVGYSHSSGGDIVYAVNMSVQGGRLFVSDAGVGVHVYDVADPSAPARRYTIPLEGNAGNAAVGDVLFASDYHSLKAFHLGNDSYVQVASIERKQREVPWMDVMPPRSRGFGCSCDQDASFAPRASSPSTGSSYATFAIVGDFLYYLDYDELVALDVADPLKPREVGRSPVNWDAETLYPTEHFLFMGGALGMYIYDRSDPERPSSIGRLVHARACDPVVVDGSTAFVTLRGQGLCGGARDELLSIDISDPNTPTLICETNIPTPHGLAAGAGRLYVSKGNNGFVLFDVSAPERPTPIASWPDATKDFIWSGGLLFSMTSNGVDIYDVADPTEPRLISTLE